MKKVIALLSTIVLSATFALGLFGCDGCGKEYSYAINWDVDLSKPIPLTGLYPETSLSSFGTDDTATIIQETTGYTITYKEVKGDADNQINSILSTRNQDYNFLKLTEAQYHPYLGQGAFVDLTELLEKTESGRKLYDLINLMDYGWDAATYVDSEGKKHIYGIPDFGYCMMEDCALIWNVDHLKQIGYVNEDGSVKVPKTVAEFTDAVNKCQEKFGGNESYHAFDIPGENCVLVTPLVSAFGVPLEFYMDEETQKIKQYVFSPQTTAYAEYMNKFYKSGVLSPAWTQGSSASSLLNFANELSSVTFQPYWWVTPLVKSIAAKGVIPDKMGVDKNDFRAVHDECIAWTTRVQGDGTNGSPVQEKPMLHGGDAGVSYYTVIPNYMSEYALYIIDFLGKKMEHFDEFYGGREGTHWNPVATPEGAKDYYEDGDYGYQQYETYKGADSIIYLRPYSYSYRVGEAKADGSYERKTVTGGGKWVKLTQRYLDNIVENSQYCNGTNRVSANVLFHLRETGYDAWQVTVPMDDSVIENPMTMSPPLKHWSVVSILSRTLAKRGVSQAIVDPDGDPAAALEVTRGAMSMRTVTGTDKQTYYFWSDDIENEMTEWYVNTKLNRK